MSVGNNSSDQNLSDLPEFLKPRLRLFLSIDLVGSTQIKQNGSFPIKVPSEEDGLQALSSDWFSPIAEFYRDFEAEFANKWSIYENSTSKECGWEPVGPAPHLWKTNGDELIYIKEIEEAHQAYACVVCWLQALIQYRKKLTDSASGLNVKGAAWVAGFPIANHEVVFKSNLEGQSTNLDVGRSSIFSHFYYLDKWYSQPSDRDDLIVDYIGPSIDTGFRVAKLATPRKFPISIELALILSNVTEPSIFRDEICLRFDGKNLMKGVLGGLPYPMFWIDAVGDDNLIKSEDELNPPPKKQDMQHVRKFCDLFINENSKFIFRPFIWNSQSSEFSKRPENYDRHLTKLSQTWNHEREKFEIEADAIEGKDPPDEDKVEEDQDPQSIDDFIQALADIIISDKI